MRKKASLIIPVYNEEFNVVFLYKKLKKIFKENYLSKNYELKILFIDDGSTDNTSKVINKLTKFDNRVKSILFTRNFGKEIALTCGLNHADCDFAITIDADLQHPPELIKEFIKKWEKGAKVVIGVKNKSKEAVFTKKIYSHLYYKLQKIIGFKDSIPFSTDFRLLDKQVIKEFNRLNEKERMTRNLIDWLGFKTTYIYFDCPKRNSGKSKYSFLKLTKLALSSFISQSLFPLKIAGYLGIIITPLAGLLGIFIIIENYLLKDPLDLNISPAATLAIFTLFLSGITLICLGLIALYIGSIHQEILSRPMYIIRKKKL